MKKVMMMIGLSGITLMAAQAAQAATVVPNNEGIKTEGSIQFSPNTNPQETGEIHKPDEKGQLPEVIELPGQGNQASGNLRIQFVPHFIFGEHQKITAAAMTESVQMLEYSNKNNPTKQKIAPFVQVTDERGKQGEDAKWTLSATATPFTADLGNGQVDTLNNVEIRLNQSTLTMDYQTSSNATSIIKGQGAQSAIKADGKHVVEVLKTADDQSTNGTNASNVFMSNYQKDQLYTQSKTDGVTFYKPAGQAPLENIAYKSTIKWTLTTGK